MNRAFFLLSTVLVGLYPAIVWPDMRVVASNGWFFSVAIKHSDKSCLIVNDAAAYARTENEARNAALVACGSGCKSIVTFQAVN